MSIKVYQEKPERQELFLRLRQYDETVLLSIVDQGGAVRETIASITANGFYPYEGIHDREELARAGLTNALDANGRLKIIGQEVEAAVFDDASYDCGSVGQGKMNVTEVGGDLSFEVWDGDSADWALFHMSAKYLRDFRDRINGHLAYVEKEGLDNP